MPLDRITAELLRKFNSGKNSKGFWKDTELSPGSYRHSVTVTIEGTLTKGEPGTSKRRNDQGSASIVRYLLDRLNPDEFNALARDLVGIRHGEFAHKDDVLFAKRLDVIMPVRKIARAGSARFDGRCIVEDCNQEPSEESQGITGLTLVVGGE